MDLLAEVVRDLEMDEFQMTPHKPWVSILKRAEVDKKRQSGIIIGDPFYGVDSQYPIAEEGNIDGDLHEDDTIEYEEDMDNNFLEENLNVQNTGRSSPLQSIAWRTTPMPTSTWYDQMENWKMRYPRPPLSYSLLVAIALRNCPDFCLFLTQIYQYICVNFPYFNSQCHTKWKSSVRHVLTKRSQWFRKKEFMDGMGETLSTRFACWEINPEEFPQIDFDIALVLQDPVNKKRLKKSVRFKEELTKMVHGQLPLKPVFYGEKKGRGNYATNKTRRLTNILNKWKEVEAEEIKKGVDFSKHYYDHRKEIFDVEESEHGSFNEARYGPENGTFEFVDFVTPGPADKSDEIDDLADDKNDGIDDLTDQSHKVPSIVLNADVLIDTSKPTIILDVTGPEMAKYRIKEPEVNIKECNDIKRGYPQPTCSYAYLVYLALKNGKNETTGEEDILRFLSKHFPYFDDDPSGCWKNAIILHLKLNKCFIKRDSGKAIAWSLDSERLLTSDKYTDKIRVYDRENLKKAMKFPNLLDSLERGDSNEGFEAKFNPPMGGISECSVQIDRSAIDQYLAKQVKAEQ